jgi:hypothetical protein
MRRACFLPTPARLAWRGFCLTLVCYPTRWDRTGLRAMRSGQRGDLLAPSAASLAALKTVAGWRPRQGSNLQPSASKADALSS